LENEYLIDEQVWDVRFFLVIGDFDRLYSEPFFYWKKTFTTLQVMGNGYYYVY